MTTTFVTENQTAHLKAALALTGSLGFMADARAVATYRKGKEGDGEQIAAIAVFECFRGGRAEMHFGMAEGHRLTPETIQGIVMLAFHPKAFDLERLVARVPVWNREAIALLVRIGFEVEYRDRSSVAHGGDAIVLSIARDDIAGGKVSAAPQPDPTPAEGE